MKAEYLQIEKSITTIGAQKMIDAAINEAQKLNFKISIAILDQAGRLKCFTAMDGAPAVSFEASIKKAKTAVGFGVPTGKAWVEMMKDDPILNAGVYQLPDFILLGGGSPVTVDGQVVGSIGISGGHYAQDEKCVAAAIKALG